MVSVLSFWLVGSLILYMPVNFFYNEIRTYTQRKALNKRGIRRRGWISKYILQLFLFTLAFGCFYILSHLVSK